LLLVPVQIWKKSIPQTQGHVGGTTRSSNHQASGDAFEEIKGSEVMIKENHDIDEPYTWISGDYLDELAALGMPLAYMVGLWIAGHNHQTITLKEFVKFTGLSRSSVIRALKVLKESKLVREDVDDSDKGRVKRTYHLPDKYEPELAGLKNSPRRA
jgi:hypothetical protein